MTDGNHFKNPEFFSSWHFIVHHYLHPDRLSTTRSKFLPIAAFLNSTFLILHPLFQKSKTRPDHVPTLIRNISDSVLGCHKALQIDEKKTVFGQPEVSVFKLGANYSFFFSLSKKRQKSQNYSLCRRGLSILSSSRGEKIHS